MKFLADMGISPKTCAFPKSLGHDCVHLLDEHLEKLPDPTILEKARDEERIILTHDLDFADLVAAAGRQLPSVIIFRLRNMNPIQVNHYIQELLATHEDVLSNGVLISVTEGQARIRQLPI
jgi:predicted nuclease of predicted toxin-antitoxin system